MLYRFNLFQINNTICLTSIGNVDVREIPVFRCVKPSRSVGPHWWEFGLVKEYTLWFGTSVTKGTDWVLRTGIRSQGDLL